jgi:hypothetical protein
MNVVFMKESLVVCLSVVTSPASMTLAVHLG